MKMERRDRYIVGVELASAVMQLHDTDWLPALWDRSYVQFNWQSGSSITENIKKPLVSPLQTLRNSNIGTQQFSNLTLFSLGILLIELDMNQPFENLLTEDEKNMNTRYPNQMAGTILATRRISIVLEGRSGPRYAGAVRRCFSANDYSPDRANLNHNDFKKDVYENIVAPLEKNLEDFQAQSLTEIFGESPCLPRGYDG